MARFGSTSELTEIQRSNPAEFPAHMRMLLERTAGHVTKAAALAGVSRPYFWWWLRRLNMNTVPTEIRRAARARFTLPPID